jgi:hypothetical protein
MTEPALPRESNAATQAHGNGAAEGAPRSLDHLPPPNTKRWVIRRKAAVVGAVRAGLLTLEEACQLYHLSVEEFLSWQRLIERHGLPGLRATRLQDYRGPTPTET